MAPAEGQPLVKVLLAVSEPRGVPLEELDGEATLRLVDSAESADCVLSVGGVCFHAHLSLLARRSEMLRQWIQHAPAFGTAELLRLEVSVPSTHAMLGTLQFLYSGIATREACTHAAGALANADYLQIPGLYQALVQQLAGLAALPCGGSCDCSPRVHAELLADVLQEQKQRGRTPQERSRFAESVVTDARARRAGAVDSLVMTARRHFAREGLSMAEGVLRSVKAEFAPADAMWGVIDALHASIEDLRCVIRCPNCDLTFAAWLAADTPCFTPVHPGDYTPGKGWSCCNTLRKRTTGCAFDKEHQCHRRLL